VFSPFERMVAFRYLRARRGASISVIAWFSLVGIALGVGALIVTQSVFNGFRAEFLSQILGLNGHIGVYAPGPAGLPDYDLLTGTVAKIPGVVSVTPMIEGQTMVTSAGGGAAFALVRGIKPADFLARDILVKGIKGGDPKAFTGDDAVVVGFRLAEKLGLHVGDPITLISPKGNATAFGTVPRIRAYHIVATFDVGMYQYDSGYVFMPLEAAQTYFQLPDRVTDLQVMAGDADHIGAIAQAIVGAGQGKLRVYDWQQANAGYLNVVKVEGNVTSLVTALIIFVAALNIISSLIMLVKDKGRDIAILRTMGATRGMIMRIFFLDGVAVGTVGTVTGTVLGLLFCWKIDSIQRFLESLTGTQLFAPEFYYLSQLPAKVDPVDVVIAVAMALGLSFGATILPSLRAARLDPVEALRYE